MSETLTLSNQEILTQEIKKPTDHFPDQQILRQSVLGGLHSQPKQRASLTEFKSLVIDQLQEDGWMIEDSASQNRLASSLKTTKLFLKKHKLISFNSKHQYWLLTKKGQEYWYNQLLGLDPQQHYNWLPTLAEAQDQIIAFLVDSQQPQEVQIINQHLYDHFIPTDPKNPKATNELVANEINHRAKRARKLLKRAGLIDDLSVNHWCLTDQYQALGPQREINLCPHQDALSCQFSRYGGRQKLIVRFSRQTSNPRPNWRDSARCLEADNAIFFPNQENFKNEQKINDFCDDCSVQSDCLESALDFEGLNVGYWASLRPTEIKTIAQTRYQSYLQDLQDLRSLDIDPGQPPPAIEIQKSIIRILQSLHGDQASFDNLKTLVEFDLRLHTANKGASFSLAIRLTEAINALYKTGCLKKRDSGEYQYWALTRLGRSLRPDLSEGTAIRNQQDLLLLDEENNWFLPSIEVLKYQLLVALEANPGMDINDQFLGQSILQGLRVADLSPSASRDLFARLKSAKEQLLEEGKIQLRSSG